MALTFADLGILQKTTEKYIYQKYWQACEAGDKRSYSTRKLAAMFQTSKAKIALIINDHDLLFFNPPEGAMSYDFVKSFNELATKINDTANEKGWWGNPEKEDADLQEMINIFEIISADSPKLLRDYLESIGWKAPSDRNEGEILALVHSEVSEGLEAIRKDLDDDKLPEFKGIEVELADAIIRIMDYAAAKKYRVAEALVAKMQYNTTREHMHGGKKF